MELTLHHPNRQSLQDHLELLDTDGYKTETPKGPSADALENEERLKVLVENLPVLEKARALSELPPSLSETFTTWKSNCDSAKQAESLRFYITALENFVWDDDVSEDTVQHTEDMYDGVLYYPES